MGAGVITVGRRSYAAGLYWENSPSGRVVQAAKEAANQPGQKADFFAVRPGSKDGRVPQFGLVQGTVGYKVAMPVFAACLANQQPGSWAGAFRLREGTVVVVVRDDLILPDGDQLYENESDARERLLQEISFGGLQRIYAPEAWSISGSDSMPISLLLDERRDVILRPVTIPKNVLIGGALLILLFFAIIGGVLYYQMLVSEEEQARLAAAAQAVPVPFQPKPPEYPPPERVWEKKPMGLEIVNACLNAMKKVPIALSGWHMASVSCNTTVLTVVWARDAVVPALPPEGASINDTNYSATLTIPFPDLPLRGPEDLMDPSAVTKRYIEQNWPGPLTPVADDPPPPPPPDYQGPWSPPPPPWIKRSFTLTVSQLPGSLPEFFGGLTGLVVNSITMTGAIAVTTSSWSIEGTIYENRNEMHQ